MRDGHVARAYRAQWVSVRLRRVAPGHGACQTDRPMGLVSKHSPLSVDDTVARISDIATDKGAKVFAVVDHSGEAAAAGLQLRNTKVVIFGSPVAGTPVMQAAPLAALDLPLKILVWDDGGQTTMTYTPPAELAARYGLSDDLAARLAAVNAIAGAVAGQ
jgi:uncharacterized protein (DUF302 family)